MKTILDPELCWRVLLTLGHFLWQGAAIALTAAAAAWLLRRALARARYGVWTAALLLMTLCPLIVLSIATIWAVEAPLENEQDPSKREAIAAAPHTITDPPAAARRDVRILDYNAVTVGKPFDQRVAVTLAQATADIKQARVDCEEYPPAPGGFRYFQPVTGGFTIPLGQRADSSTQPAAQPATNSAAMVAEAFERIHQRVAALEGQHPALKGIADAKPLFGGDSAFTRREADWSFANNATGWGKAETPSAVDVSKPFCRIILYMRFPFGAMGVQPVADQRVYQVGGEAWEGFSKVFSDDAKLVEAVKTIAKEELDRFTGPPPRPAATAPSAALPAPPANLTVQLRIDPKKLALFNLSLTDVRQALTERKITVTGERVDAAGQHELDLDPDRLPKVEDLRRIVIKTPAGLSVPLEQVANILAVARDRATGAQPAKLPGNTDEQAEVERHAAENEKNMAAQKARDDQSAAAARQRDDEIAAAMRKAAQAKAAIAPEFIAKIKAMLPDGWSVATAKDVLTIRRDEKVEATYMSPGGITPERISTSDVIQIRVGPRVSGEQYARMAEENRKVLDDFRFKNPNYSPIDYRIALPHVLPTHFDEQHSLWISSRLLNGGHIEFKSKEVFDECSRAYVGVEGLFYNYGEFEQHLADLRSPDRETCRKAARTLGEMGPKAAPAVPALLGLLKDKTNPGGFIAGDAHAAIVSIGVPLAADIPAVAGVLKDGDPRVRQDALHLLGNLAYKHTSDDALERMVPEVIGMLASADYATQSAAINFLRWLGPHAAPASAALAALLTHTEPSLRWQAAEALGLIGPAAKHVIPALAAAMADPDPKVRAHTAAALKSLKGKETK